MKNILSLLILLLPCFAFAQKKSIDGFMDIPFGSDSATIKNAVFTKGGKQIDSLSRKDNLAFLNFSLGQRHVMTFFVTLLDNKAFDASFYFVESDELTVAFYNNLVEDITAVYGKPSKTDNFNQFNNATKIRKVRSGNIVIKTVWQSKNKNTITVQIKSADQIVMTNLEYQDSALWDQYDARRRSDL